MLLTLTKAERITRILSKYYTVKILKDTDLDLSDDTNLCLSIKNNPEIDEIQKLVKPLKAKAFKYGDLVVFKLD